MKNAKGKRPGWVGPLVFLLCVVVASLGFRLVWLPHMYPREHRAAVEQWAAEYDLPRSLVYAVIKTESDFDPEANSLKDARGLMQILHSTGSWAAENLELEDYTESSLYDVDTNIRIGCWYLARLYKQFGSLSVALAAYNAGEGNVTRWLAQPEYSDDGKTLKEIPYPETADYVETVLVRQTIYEKLYESKLW